MQNSEKIVQNLDKIVSNLEEIMQNLEEIVQNLEEILKNFWGNFRYIVEISELDIGDILSHSG